MKKVFAILAVLVSLALIASPALAGFNAQTNGSGHILIGDSLRTFTFNARTNADGVTTGTANIVRHDLGAHIQIDINCLVVSGNSAFLSGIGKSTDPAYDGQPFLFQVVDGGEGKNSTDAISLAYLTSLTCASQANLPLIPISGGNVQVK